MDLREPRRKRVGPNVKAQQPFPVLIESESGISVSSNLWTIYSGIFTGNSVSVTDREEMMALYNMGFFGKGSLSRRGYPNFGVPKKGIPHMIKEQQWNRRKKWMQEVCGVQGTANTTVPHSAEQGNKNNASLRNSENISNSMTVRNIEMKKEKEDVTHEIASGRLCESNQVAVFPDSDNEIEPTDGVGQFRIESEPVKTVVEMLSLTLEEAFFLSFGLGCLQVFDSLGQFLTIKAMWYQYREAQNDFIESYIAYHYFRAKGWVVKHGHKFGGDFLLYKQGPPFNHASYLVLIEAVNKDGNRKDVTQKSANWINFMALTRVAETAGKDVLICQVIWPASLIAEELDSPNVIRKFQVNEILVRRWVSSQERDEKES